VTRVAVVGGTGVVGRHVVAVLTERGHDCVVMSRSHGVDVVNGGGLDQALVGTRVLVDVGNITTLRRATAVRWFESATANLLAAAERSGVQHYLLLSIVGIDRVDTGYYAGKRRQEEVALAGQVPVTVLRATQFHEFAEQVMDRGGVGPVRLVPRMRVQPVAAREVAEALSDLVAGDAVRRAPDVGGPEEHDLVDLARRAVAVRGPRRLVAPVPVPGAAGREIAAGALLPGEGARLGRTTFEQWLTA
jgi:uncharacterized protein YbjT (DUF2867 family)